LIPPHVPRAAAFSSTPPPTFHSVPLLFSYFLCTKALYAAFRPPRSALLRISIPSASRPSPSVAPFFFLHLTYSHTAPDRQRLSFFVTPLRGFFLFFSLFFFDPLTPVYNFLFHPKGRSGLCTFLSPVPFPLFYGTFCPTRFEFVYFGFFLTVTAIIFSPFFFR